MSEIRVANLAEPTQEEINKSVIKRAEEVLNIVHCKDCKYLHQLPDGQIFCEIKDGLPLMIGDLTADDFCSRGERKDG